MQVIMRVEFVGVAVVRWEVFRVASVIMDELVRRRVDGGGGQGVVRDGFLFARLVCVGSGDVGCVGGWVVLLLGVGGGRGRWIICVLGWRA